MSISEILRPAMNFTIQMRILEKNDTADPNKPASVGSAKDKRILKKPKIRIKATKGKATTVQILVSGFIV